MTLYNCVIIFPRGVKMKRLPCGLSRSIKLCVIDLAGFCTSIGDVDHFKTTASYYSDYTDKEMIKGHHFNTRESIPVCLWKSLLEISAHCLPALVMLCYGFIFCEWEREPFHVLFPDCDIQVEADMFDSCETYLRGVYCTCHQRESASSLQAIQPGDDAWFFILDLTWIWCFSELREKNVFFCFSDCTKNVSFATSPSTFPWVLLLFLHLFCFIQMQIFFLLCLIPT